jgi:hypothetical protein
MERLAGEGEKDIARVMDAYLDAHRLRPSRAEAVRHLIRFLESRKQQGFTENLQRLLPKEPTQDILFVEAWAYR